MEEDEGMEEILEERVASSDLMFWISWSVASMRTARAETIEESDEKSGMAESGSWDWDGGDATDESGVESVGTSGMGSIVARMIGG